MSEEDFTIQMPFKGLSVDKRKGQQDPGTTRDAANVRSQDPTNGIERISQRSGLSKANSAQVEVGVKVAELVSTVVDVRNVSYSFVPGSEELVWAAAIPSNASVAHVATDGQGNVYVTDGNAGLVKLNADGHQLWQFALPAPEPEHVVRFVHVDDLFDVYVGVSHSGLQDSSRLWKLRQLPDDEVEVAWEVELTAYVETAKVYRDKLYTLQNEPDVKRAYVRVYSRLDAPAPVQVQEWPVPYPGHDMDLNARGDVFVAVADDGDGGASLVDIALTGQRGPNPTHPRLAPEAQSWTPFKLSNFSKRVWSWYCAADIDEFDVVGTLDEDIEVLRWPDRSGKKRHLYAAFDLGAKAPTLVFEALGSHPAVRFNGEDQGLSSKKNTSVELEAAEQQKSALPMYKGSAFATIIVLRPELRTTGNPMWVFAQPNDASGGIDHMLIANRQAGSSLPGTFASGMLCHYAASDAGDPGQGANGHPLEGSFANFNQTTIVTILHDGGLNPGDSSSSRTRSLFQVDGTPVDRYEGKATHGLGATAVGVFDNPSSGFDFYKGDILEWITLDLANREDTVTEPIILSHDAREPGAGNQAQTDNELTQIVGYLAHKYGLQHLLPPESGIWEHPYGATQIIEPGARQYAIAGPPLAGALGAHGRTQRSFSQLAKYSAQGELLWVASSEDDDPDEPGTFASGFGFGVRVDHEGNLFSFGNTAVTDNATGSTRTLRKIIDQGSTFSLLTADGAWSMNVGPPGYSHPRMTVDPSGNVYVPLATGTVALKVFKGTDGTELASFDIGGGLIATSVAIDPKIPDYEDDLSTDVARFVYLGGSGGDPATPVRKIRLVQETPVVGSPRQHVHLAISGQGAIRRYEVGGASMTAPTGAAGLLSSTANYIHAASGFGRIIITDGISPLVTYDPREDVASELESTTPGDPPHGARVVEFWSGRFVYLRASGLINGAFNWMMSAKGRPTDFNTFDTSRRSDAAVAGDSVQGPGFVPDLPNCFIPVNDDIAYFGCDHAIYQLTGDPGAGGEFDLVSDITGIAFGRAWAKDPEGRVWFVGSRGGLFVMPPGGLPQRISLYSFERRLADIDFGTHYVRLVWNDEDQGIHIMRFAFGSPGTPLEHWFYDTKRGAAWPDTFGTALAPGVDPTAIYVVDGDDAEDRLVLFGGRDGYVRQWDRDAKDDDGTAIDAHVLVGPFAGDESHREYRFVGPRVVLATEQHGALFELFASRDPAFLGSAKKIGELHAGPNPLRRRKVRGSYVFIRFRNSVAGQRFAIEEAAMRAYPAGLKRVRRDL